MSLDRPVGQTRRSSRLSSGSSSSELSQISEDELRHSNIGGKQKSKPNVRAPPLMSDAGTDEDTSSPEDGDDEGSDDEGEASEDEPDVQAPSDALKKRGHQTGLSMSFSETKLGKRGRSPLSDEDIERPVSKMSKTSATAESDDDDDYNAVDDISESEEDGEVEHHEEQLIIESEEEDTTDQLRRGSQSSLDSFLGLDNPEIETYPIGAQNLFNELFPDASNTVLHEEEEDGSAPTVRRVRFADDVELHSSGSTTATEDEDDFVYPDLFLQQSSLDPAFRKLIEQKDDENRSSDGDSYWDFENDHGGIEERSNDSGSESGSSGYETDEGETTDEEILPPRTVSKPLTSLRHNAGHNNRSKASQATLTTPTRRSSTGVVRRGPLMGSFLIDDDKPIAVVDGHGKHMLFFPAPKHRRQAVQGAVAASSPGPAGVSTYHAASETESDIGFSQTDPMLSSPANVMMSGFGQTRTRSASGLSSEITGPPEAFFPFTSINSNGIMETDDLDDDTFEDYSDEEDNLRIEDFINFGDDDDASSSEDEDRQEAELTDSNNTTADDNKDPDKTPQAPRSKFPVIKNRQPTTPTPANPGSLLEHFDKGVVSSFRRNNDRHKSWTRNPVNAGIKGSRLHAADAPISPLRRRRGGSISSSIGRSPLRTQTSQHTETGSQHVHHQFGGPLMKRIQNSNHIRRSRKNTL